MSTDSHTEQSDGEGAFDPSDDRGRGGSEPADRG